MRGNLILAGIAVDRMGTIPACAGEPPSKIFENTASRDHPRVCGGTGVPMLRAEDAEGPSPRVRGNPPQCASRYQSSGTIPACAGEPHGRGGRDSAQGDHPRVCGGTGISEGGGARRMGPSPRVRGNLRQAGWCSLCRGTIPACAGEPKFASTRVAWTRDHPRVCGGTDQQAVIGIYQWGPSPRVRGNQNLASGVTFHPGTIPACAGEPQRGLSLHARKGDHPRVCGGTLH